MALFKITPEDVETFTLETHPRREYFSGSIVSLSPGVTGTLYVFPRRSDIEKEVQPLSAYSSSMFGDTDLSYYLNSAKTFASTSNNNQAQVSGYMSGVYQQQPSARKQQTVSIYRFIPPFRFNKYTGAKLLTINSLMPYYRATQPVSHFSITNYNTLNFFTASSVPGNTAILYPNPTVAGQYPYGQYTPTGAWSMDFWINPRYTNDTPQSAIKAGTLLHLSGVFAVSLISGSSRDINGYINGYRLQIQLSSSANLSPSLATTSDPLVFRTTDNSLTRNTWHHVSIRHSNTYNAGTGSILIDTNINSEFVFTGTLAPSSSGAYGSTEGPIVLCVGNFYQGTNTSTSGMSRFFSGDVATRDGIYELNSVAGVDYPAAFLFDHPLNAEVHDLKIFNKYLTNTEVSGFQSQAPTTLDNMLFYVPPFFTLEAPSQSFYNGYGGVMVTPFQTNNSTTMSPFNVTMSFGVGGMYMNLENYGKDFATNRFPRWLGLTGSVLDSTADILSANVFLFATASNRKRQYTIMPCDNGSFYPNFNILGSGSTSRFVNDLGNTNLSMISLRELVPLVGDKTNGIVDSGSFVDSMIGATPDNLSGSFSDSLAILHRTKDNTSNQCVFFDISNLYYGSNIKPGSFQLRDTSLSASAGKLAMTIKDDGNGNLFRADCLGNQATWASIGNIFYNEGIVLLKSPQLYFFGEEYWEMEFQGKQDIHVLKFNLILPPLMATSSSNPSYLTLSASNLANDTDTRFVYLSGIQLHDDNLNVIGKTSFAQPIVKRTGDKLMFKVRQDF